MRMAVSHPIIVILIGGCLVKVNSNYYFVFAWIHIFKFDKMDAVFSFIQLVFI